MDKIWVVGMGTYSDAQDIGYFLTEEDAKAYCELKNKGRCQWTSYWYHELKPLDLVKIKSEIYYKHQVSLEFSGELIDIFIEAEEGEMPQNTCQIYAGEVENEFEAFECDVYLKEIDEERALKIAVDTLAQVKEKYYECQDMNLVMDSVGGAYY